MRYMEQKITLNGFPGETPFICMIRHAEKQTIKSDPFVNSAQLTKMGKKEAYRFGQKFLKDHNEIDMIRTSPLPRCVETSLEISKAFENEVKIEKSNLLGNPGVYIENLELAGKYFLEMNVKEVVQNLIDGIKMDGFRDINSGNNMLVEQMKMDLSTADISIIYVTHDVVLVPFFCSRSGKKDASANWFDYLDPLFIWKSDDEIFSVK